MDNTDLIRFRQMEMAMSHVNRTHTVSHSASLVAGVVRMLGTAVSTVALWVRRHNERRELRELLAQPDYLLKDIGLRREDIMNHAVKPFWRP